MYDQEGPTHKKQRRPNVKSDSLKIVAKDLLLNADAATSQYVVRDVRVFSWKGRLAMQ